MRKLHCRTPTNPETGLTRRQSQLVRVLFAYFREHMRWPTFRELSRLMGCNPRHPNSMLSTLHLLVRKGVLSWPEGTATRRCFRLAGLEWEHRFTDTPEGERLKKILGQGD